MPGPNPMGDGSGGDQQLKATVALGAVIKVSPATFERLLTGQTAPLVVRYVGGWLRLSYRYLTAYKGLFFYTKSSAGRSVTYATGEPGGVIQCQPPDFSIVDVPVLFIRRYRFGCGPVRIGKVSVRNGDAGRPLRLNRLQWG